MRDALASAITENFYISIVVGVIIFGALLAMKELRLRTAEDVESSPNVFASYENASLTSTMLAKAPNTVPPVSLVSARSLMTRDSVFTPSADRSVPRLIFDLRLPPLPHRSIGRASMVGALLLGVVAGLAVTGGSRHHRPPRLSTSAKVLAPLRRRLADRIDPPCG